MNNDPLVSVIMPTYNQGAFIGDAIRSVIEQTYTRLELIVVDNFSSDNTRQVVASFSDKRLQYFQYRNQGVIAASRNYGASKSAGEVLAFLDSDDVWEADKLSRQLPYLWRDEVVCVGSDFCPMGDQDRCVKLIGFAEGEEYRDLSYETLVLRNPLATSSAILDKQIFLACHGFDESRDLCFIEDWDLWLRVAKLGRVRLLAAPLVQYRIVRRKNRDERDVRLRSLKILEKHRSLGFLDAQLYATAVGNRCVTIGKAFLEAHDAKGRSYYMQGLKYSRGLRNKMSALAGLLLYQLPLGTREFLLSYYYRRQSAHNVH